MSHVNTKKSDIPGFSYVSDKQHRAGFIKLAYRVLCIKMQESVTPGCDQSNDMKHKLLGQAGLPIFSLIGFLPPQLTKPKGIVVMFVSLCTL